MNGSPDAIAGLNDLPVRTQRRHDHLPARRRLRARRLLAADQHRAPGRRARRAALGAEERRRVDARHRRQPAARCCRAVQAILPADVKVTPLFDQSVFVKAAVKGVVIEALIAAGLTAVMVLLFLGNWRSTLIIALTIPLSILASILVAADARRDAQPDDARRPRALGRHPGRPGDRDDREHRAPPAPRQAARGGDRRSAPARSACRRSSRRCASASSSCRCSSSPASRASCSCRWPRRWCSR